MTLYFGTVLIETAKDYTAVATLVLAETLEQAEREARAGALAKRPDGTVTDVKLSPAPDEVVRGMVTHFAPADSAAPRAENAPVGRVAVKGLAYGAAALVTGFAAGWAAAKAALVGG